jgi:hypothetical protein
MRTRGPEPEPGRSRSRRRRLVSLRLGRYRTGGQRCEGRVRPSEEEEGHTAPPTTGKRQKLTAPETAPPPEAARGTRRTGTNTGGCAGRSALLGCVTVRGPCPYHGGGLLRASAALLQLYAMPAVRISQLGPMASPAGPDSLLARAVSQNDDCRTLRQHSAADSLLKVPSQRLATS